MRDEKTALDCVQDCFLTADHDSWLAWLFLQTFYLRLTPPLSYCTSATVLINHTPWCVQHCVHLCVCVCVSPRIGEGMCSWNCCDDYKSLHINFISKLSLTRKYVVSDDNALAIILGYSLLPEWRIIQSLQGSGSVQIHMVAERAGSSVILLPDMAPKKKIEGYTYGEFSVAVGIFNWNVAPKMLMTGFSDSSCSCSKSFKILLYFKWITFSLKSQAARPDVQINSQKNPSLQ